MSTYENMEVANEDLIKKAAILLPPDNCYEVALSVAEEYRRAGLTPVFLLNYDETMIIVTNQEKMDGKFS
jgi:hypothetical protein